MEITPLHIQFLIQNNLLTDKLKLSMDNYEKNSDFAEMESRYVNPKVVEIVNWTILSTDLVYDMTYRQFNGEIGNISYGISKYLENEEIKDDEYYPTLEIENVGGDLEFRLRYHLLKSEVLFTLPLSPVYHLINDLGNFSLEKAADEFRNAGFDVDTEENLCIQTEFIKITIALL